LQGIVQTLRDKGANLLVTEQSVDTSTASGKAFFQMLGVFAEFETNIRRERQMEGIAKAKAKGVYKGRKRTIDANEVKRLKDLGKGQPRSRTNSRSYAPAFIGPWSCWGMTLRSGRPS
jgi:DNA invertase Pin-like site-specific DNA recombinase